MDERPVTEQELVLRDRFALAAMQALIGTFAHGYSVAGLCRSAYGHADAMLKARKGVMPSETV